MTTTIECSIGHMGTLMIGEMGNLSLGDSFGEDLKESAIALWNTQEPFVSFDEFDGIETGE